MNLYTTNPISTSLELKINDLDDLPVWNAWQLQSDKYTDKLKKIPYDPHSTWKWAKADDPTTWGTRRQAEARARLLPKPFGLGGVGVQFGPLATTPGAPWLGGVDLDACRDKLTGEIAAWARPILTALDSYSEVSPSGTGIKTFLLVAAADVVALREVLGGEGFGTAFRRAGGEHPPAIEFYMAKRYFAFTDEMLVDSTLELRLMPRAVLLDLLTITGPTFATDGRVFSQEKGCIHSPREFTGTSGGSDTSRSGKALKIAIKRTAAGDSEGQIYAVLQADPETAGWLREKGDLYDKRQFKRTCEAARSYLAAQLAENEFEALEPAP